MLHSLFRLIYVRRRRKSTRFQSADLGKRPGKSPILADGASGGNSKAKKERRRQRILLWAFLVPLIALVAWVSAVSIANYNFFQN